MLQLTKKLDAVRDRLMKPAPGVFMPMFAGHFDLLGDDVDRDRHRQGRCAYAERCSCSRS